MQWVKPGIGRKVGIKEVESGKQAARLGLEMRCCTTAHSSCDGLNMRGCMR